jgi:hypothetical protein
MQTCPIHVLSKQKTLLNKQQYICNHAKYRTKHTTGKERKRTDKYEASNRVIIRKSRQIADNSHTDPPPRASEEMAGLHCDIIKSKRGSKNKRTNQDPSFSVGTNLYHSVRTGAK